jgi:subtilase family serine protease
MMKKKLESTFLRLTLLCLGTLSITLSTPLFAIQKAHLKDRVAATEQVSFDIYLPLQNRAQLEQELQALHDPSSASYRKWLTPAEFNSRYGASPSQLAAIQKQLASYGLQSTFLTAERLHVTGPAASVEQALNTVLKHGVYANGKTTVVASQPIVKSGALAQSNAAITGLSGIVRMRTHSQAVQIPQNRYSPAGPYWFDDLKQAYSFPSFKAYTGKGVTIGILMSGDFNPSDMAAYFGHEKLAVPNYKTKNIDGGLPFDPNNSFETHLDLQQSGGMAPDAKIILYNIPDLSDDSIIDALAQIVSDNKADVVSMSFGEAEIFYTAADNDGTDFTYLAQAEDDLMAEGNALGITFIASSGDSGALPAVPIECFNFGPNCGSFLPGVNFPSSSPHVTGVGGTNLVTTYTPASLNSVYVREQAFADPLAVDIFYGTSAIGGYWGSGGGDSILFRKPLFQALTDTGNPRFRTVPDLSLHMGGCPAGTISACDPDDSSVVVAIGGGLFAVIGTSASAPDFAGLTALNIQRQGGRLGNENYYIYTLAALQDAGLPIKVFKTGIPGFNGLFHTTPKGYNRVLGNGTLNGVNFMLAPFIPVAGTPQTPSNP